MNLTGSGSLPCETRYKLVPPLPNAKGVNLFPITLKTRLLTVFQLGDFGRAVFPNAPRDRYDYNKACTYLPPVSCVLDRRSCQVLINVQELCNSRILRPGQVIEQGKSIPDTVPKTNISSKSDVWGVGFTMWSLLSGSASDTNYKAAQNEFGQCYKEMPPRMGLIDSTAYSQRLLNLIVSCNIEVLH